jgi:hypothetical protein
MHHLSPFWPALFAAVVCCVAPSNAQEQLPDLLPRDLETELALSALPPHLRNDATAYVLERGGYKKVTNGTNGFSCLVRRNGAVPGPYFDSMIPICYDKEGSETLLVASLDEVRLLEQGLSFAEVARRIDGGWKSGKYRVPGPGISYMMSPVFKATTARGTSSYIPHIMFYGPYKTNADIGASEERFGPTPFMQASGLPSGMIVVPLGENERKAIIELEADLIKRAAPYLE